MTRAGNLLRRAAVRLKPTARGPVAGSGVVVTYQPAADGRADPGEVVWAWVPYEEDATQGKDRPVLVVGRDGGWLVGLMLSSQDHDARQRADRARGHVWMDVGAGGWDRQRRPSEVRIDRVLQLDPRKVRREGAALDPARFRTVANAARKLHGWA